MADCDYDCDWRQVLQELRREAQWHFSLVRTRDDLSKVRTYWLGKNGVIKQLFKALKNARERDSAT